MYLIKFNSLEDVNVVFAGLSELPMKVGYNIFESIRQQVAEQDPAKIKASDVSSTRNSQREDGGLDGDRGDGDMDA